jgi:hypothetical protein
MFAAELGRIFVGLQFTTAFRRSVFLYLAPFVVALGMPRIARSERLSALQGLGLVAGLRRRGADLCGRLRAPRRRPEAMAGRRSGRAA